MKRRPTEIPYIPKDRRRSRLAPRKGGTILKRNKGVEALQATNADAWGKKSKATNGCGCLFVGLIVSLIFGWNFVEPIVDDLLSDGPTMTVTPAPSPEPVPIPGEEALAPPPAAEMSPPPPTTGPFTPPVGNFAGLFSTDDYPVRELADGIEGVTRATLVVGTDGRVADCTIAQGSGSEALDARTCEIFRARARFEPARDADGNPLRASVAAPPVAWTIPE